jgi:hypothetical protein
MARTRSSWLRVGGACVVAALAIALAAGLFVRTPNPLIHVRWEETVDAPARGALERQFQLLPVEQVGVTTWRYELTETSRANVGAIVGHAAVEDTHFINRTSFAIDPEAPSGPRRPGPLAGPWPTLALALVDYGPLILLAFAAAAALRGFGLQPSAAVESPPVVPAARLGGRILPLGIAAAAPAWLVVTFLAGSIPDDEELRWGILSSFLHVRALADATWPTWSSALGLGMPQPMIPNFHMHPLVPLLAVISPVNWLRLLYAAHTVIASFGMWRLGRMLRLTPLTAAVCVFTFLLATPTQNYALTDLWPSHFVMWTSAPWLLLLAWRLLESEGREALRLSVLLGLAAGIVLASTHPGHAPVYATVVLALAAARWDAMLARWRPLLIAAAIALTIASPNLLQLSTERQLFAQDARIEKLYPSPLPLSAAWEVFFRPLPLPSAALTTSYDALTGELEAQDTRVLFFGGPFAVLSLLGIVLFARSRPDLALGTLLSTVLLFTSLLPLAFLSRFHFRDPALLCAIPLAGLAADYLLARRRTSKAAALLLLTAQMFVVTAAALPFVAGLWDDDARQAMWYRGATADTDVADRIVSSITTPGRLAFSSTVDSSVMGRQERLADGLVDNALAYRGVALVNGSFKGVSMDVLWPSESERMFYGRTRVPRQLVESDAGLDVLGIRYVLAAAGEPVAPGLQEIATIQASASSLRLYENPDTSQGAVVLPDRAEQPRVLPAYPGCLNDRLFCKDLTTLARLQHEDRVHVVRRGSRIDITAPGGTERRLLVVAEMFRPAWVAQSGDGRLATLSIGPGLLGIILPPGTTGVRLDFRPLLLISATLLAWCAAAGSVAAVVVLARPGTSRS